MTDTLRSILDLGLAINTVVETVRQNREDCRETRSRVEILRAILVPLEQVLERLAPENDTGLVISAALKTLQEHVDRAHKLVLSCQQRRTIIEYLRYGKISRQLQQVNRDISEQMMVVNFASIVEVIVTIRHFQDGAHPSRPEVAEVRVIGHVKGPFVEGRVDDIAPIPSRYKEKVVRFHFSTLEDATTNFSEKNVIGKGVCDIVYKGELPKTTVADQALVAIKRFGDKSGPSSIKQYFSAFRLLIGHENIVQFLGYCHADQEGTMVVEEYMPNRRFSDIINGSKDWSSTFRIIQGTAKGVSYMHSKSVLHLNLIPSNIVCDSHMNPKICGFERSKIQVDIETETVTEELVGITGYMAPELLTHGGTSGKSDVFSFGVLLLHTISAMIKPLIHQHPIEWAWRTREAGSVKELLDSSSFDESQQEKIERCIDIGLLCTEMERGDRPTMAEVLQMLDSTEKLPTPEKPGFIN